MKFPIKFSKMTGTGNDFILIDNRRGVVLPEEMKELAVMVCRRRQSVGADGLILLKDDTGLDFAWDFFNSDGSVPEMCGNGARCAARFALLEGISGPEMVFGTIAGPIRGQVNGTTVKVQLTGPQDLKETIELPMPDGSRPEAGFVNTGVPHVVILLSEGRLTATDVQGIGRHIRYHQDFAPAGTNVNFMEAGSNDSLMIRTYERGVEGETLACGTGAVAAAIIGTIRGLVTPPVNVITASGETLRIHLDPGDPMSGDVFLEGEASLVYRGELTEETVHGR